MIAGVLIYDFDGPEPRYKLAEVVESFRAGCKAANLDMFDAPPLPHAPPGAVPCYCPVMIDVSYSFCDQAWKLTLDAMPLKSNG